VVSRAARGEGVSRLRKIEEETASIDDQDALAGGRARLRGVESLCVPEPRGVGSERAGEGRVPASIASGSLPAMTALPNL